MAQRRTKIEVLNEKISKVDSKIAEIYRSYHRKITNKKPVWKKKFFVNRFFVC